jgi:calcium-translocating P-type ATPase
MFYGFFVLSSPTSSKKNLIDSALWRFLCNLLETSTIMATSTNLHGQTATAWHVLDATNVLATLHCNPNGLSGDEANNRLTQYGPNVIKRKSKDGLLTLLWRQINSPLIWVLLCSCAVAMALGKVTDGTVVLAVVVINTIIGFIQEFKAGKAIEALSDMVPENASVLRNGHNVMVAVGEVVPGDIVFLAAGDRVPADVRIIQQKNLQVEEAALTGESLPSQKTHQPVTEDAVLGDRKCMAYAGTLVASGTAMAVVVATGMATELGKISDMLSEATDLETPLTKKLAVISNWLTIGIGTITVVIMAIGTWRATEQGIAMGTAIKDSLVFAIALAVGAIPEGLPAVVTIALAIGVQRMAKRKAIIRKLPAVETLGSTTVICSDKTGTLTRNEMTVSELWTPMGSVLVTGVGYNKKGVFRENGETVTQLPDHILRLLHDAVLCNDSSIKEEGDHFEITGDPTEVALLVAAAKANLQADALRGDFTRLNEIPFDSELQYMATLNDGIAKIAVVKGAPEVVLKRCNRKWGGDVLDHALVIAEIEKLGNKGMRVLAVAEKPWGDNASSSFDTSDVEDGLLFVGLIGMIDPPRQEAIDAIKACHAAGIVVKMITGDHRATARSIGMELGLSNTGDVVVGADLAKMDEQQLMAVAGKTNIFARVAPEHKLRLVKALQQQGHVVAMTGDGVNDAPSLKQANIGVAMGITGTSVSKESADIVLADDNFASIGAAVEEGRRVFDNLLKSLAFLLPTNLGLAFILVYGIMFFPFNPITNELLLPMLPTQLLWINLVAAGTLALPLAFEVMEPNVMRRPPRKPGAPLFTVFVTLRVMFVSLLMTAGTILLFNWHYGRALSKGGDAVVALEQSQTMAVTFVIAFQVFYMINCRSLKQSVLKIGVSSNQYVFWGIGAIVLLQAFFIYLPSMQRVFGTTALGLADIVVSVLAGMAVLPIIGAEKWVNAMIEKS